MTPRIHILNGNIKWCIAANVNIIHVVWQEHRDGNAEIYYKRSMDGGTTGVQIHG